MDRKVDSRLSQDMHPASQTELPSLRQRIEQQKRATPVNEIYPQIRPIPLKSPTEIPQDTPKDFPLRIGFNEGSKTILENKTGQQFHRGPVSRRNYPRMFWSATAALIDGLVLFSLSCFLIMSFKAITHISWVEFKELITHQKAVFIAFSAIWIYFFMVIQRAFLGFSIGEWACGLRLGLISQRLRGNYILLVIGRMSLVSLTGFILLPICSLITGYDIAGIISRIPLVDEFFTASLKNK